MRRQCPNCHQVYDTVLDRFNDRPVQEQFPHALPWECEGSIVFWWSETLGKRLIY